MRIKRIKYLMVVLGVAALCLSGCGRSEEENCVRIGYFPNITHSQALLMKEQKSLEHNLGEEYQVEWVSFNAGPAEVEALFAEELDIGYIGPVPAINANVKSEGDVVIIANACNGGAVLLAGADSGIETVADLAGKKVAIPQIGNTQHLNLLHLMEENGLSSIIEGGTVDVQPVANADMQILFQQQRLDAALVPEPWGSLLERDCGAQVVLEADEIMGDGNYPTAVVVIRKEFMEKEPEIVQAFLEEHLNATDFIIQNLDAAVELVNKQIYETSGKQYDSEVLKSAFKRLQIDAEVNEAALEKFAEIGKEQGFISKIPERLVDMEMLEAIE